MQASVSGNPSPGLAAGETGIPTSSSSSPRSMPVLVQCAVHVRTLVRRAQRFMTVSERKRVNNVTYVCNQLLIHWAGVFIKSTVEWWWIQLFY